MARRPWSVCLLFCLTPLHGLAAQGAPDEVVAQRLGDDASQEARFDRLRRALIEAMVRGVDGTTPAAATIAGAVQPSGAGSGLDAGAAQSSGSGSGVGAGAAPPSGAGPGPDASVAQLSGAASGVDAGVAGDVLPTEFSASTRGANATSWIEDTTGLGPQVAGRAMMADRDPHDLAAVDLDDPSTGSAIPAMAVASARTAGSRHRVDPSVPSPRPAFFPFERVAAIEPAIGPDDVLPPARRDPILPPLLDDQLWREWILAVTLNGARISEGALFLEEPRSGRLALSAAQARQWRLEADPADLITFQGEPFLPLDLVEGARWSFDQQTLSLELTVPGSAFETSALSVARAPTPEARSGVGAFVDYDLLYSAGDTIEQGLDGLAEFGAFAPFGVLTSSQRFQDVTDDFETTRLETRFTKDLPGQRASVRLGDSLTTGGQFGAPTRFGGLQYATNFATDPSFVRFPIPSIGGLAEQNSTVEVFIDNLRQASRQVPPGPFQFDDIPVVTGAGEMQLRVTDLLGRERIVTQTYYVSSRLLREGLHDFAYELGLERDDYGSDSFDYGDALASVTHRYGLTDKVTVEAHGEAEADSQTVVAGGTMRLGNFGVLSGGAGVSSDNGEGIGITGELGWDYNGKILNLGIRSRYTDESYRSFGDDGRTERVDSANIGVDLFGYGRLGVAGINEKRFHGEDRRLVNATYSLPLGPGTFMITGSQQLEPDNDFIVGLTYSMPLGPTRSLSAQANHRDDSQSARLQFRQSRGTSDLGLDYSVASEIGDDPRTLDLRANYQTGIGGASLDLERFDGDNNGRIGIDGSLALVDGTLRPSRRLGSAFGLVNVPGVSDVRVYLNNREAGRTDSSGKLLLPGLQPYQSNKVRLEIEDIPLDVEVDGVETGAVPFERSGITIAFDAGVRRQATASFRSDAGDWLPAGLTLANSDGSVTAIVGRDGFAMVEGPIDRSVEIGGTFGDRRFVCVLPPAERASLLPDLGAITCSD